MSGSFNLSLAEFEQRRASLYNVADLDEIAEAVAAHANRVNPDMNQNFDAVRKRQPDGVARIFHKHGNFAAYGRANRFIRGLNRQAVADHFFRENAVANFLEADNFAVKVRFNFALALKVGFSFRLRRLSRRFRLSLSLRRRRLFVDTLFLANRRRQQERYDNRRQHRQRERRH